MGLVYARDVAIILLAIQSLVIGVLLLLTLGQVRKLMRMLREEIAPMLESLNATLHTVQGTAHIVSHTVVDPLIKASSYSAGTVQAIRSLLALRTKLRSEEEDDGQGRRAAASPATGPRSTERTHKGGGTA